MGWKVSPGRLGPRRMGGGKASPQGWISRTEPAMPQQRTLSTLLRHEFKSI
jgi:hypothetical protein